MVESSVKVLHLVWKELRTDLGYTVANIGHMVGDISADAYA